MIGTLHLEGEVTVGTLTLEVALSFAPGEVVAIVGPNGAGKTTLARVIAGLVGLDRGTLRVGDERWDHPADAIFLRPEHRRVGVVFQDLRLFDHLSATENVAFGPRHLGLEDPQSIACRWIERVGLRADEPRPIPELSGGERQRLALARALASEPNILLLDEPFAAVDAETRDGVRALVAQSSAAVTMVITHDRDDVLALADRVIALDRGRVTADGTIHEVAAGDRGFAARMLGSLQ